MTFAVPTLVICSDGDQLRVRAQNITERVPYGAFFYRGKETTDA